MAEKVILDPSNKAVLACSKCFRQKEVDMTQFLVVSHITDIKIGNVDFNGNIKEFVKNYNKI